MQKPNHSDRGRPQLGCVQRITGDTTPALLEVHQVAYRLGCSQGHVRRLIRDRKLPASQVGAHYRIDPRELEVFAQAQRCECGPW